jgi:ribosomal protein S6--L-glutamate ligase
MIFGSNTRKMGQSVLSRIPATPPDTIPWISVDEFRTAIHKDGLSRDFPFLLKGRESHEGEGVFLITDPDALESTLKVLREWEKTGQSGFVSQALIESGGNVLRAVLLENRIITYWKRPRLQGSLITTISRNAFVDKDWRKDLQEKGRVQTKIFGRELASMWQP